MIWIVASIPFWIAGTTIAFAGVIGLGYASFSSRIPSGSRFNELASGSVAFLLVGGALMALAAKLCS